MTFLWQGSHSQQKWHKSKKLSGSYHRTKISKISWTVSENDPFVPWTAAHNVWSASVEYKLSHEEHLCMTLSTYVCNSDIKFELGHIKYNFQLDRHDTVVAFN